MGRKLRAYRAAAGLFLVALFTCCYCAQQPPADAYTHECKLNINGEAEVSLSCTKLAAATGCTLVAYIAPGHSFSSPSPEGASLVMQALPGPLPEARCGNKTGAGTENLTSTFEGFCWVQPLVFLHGSSACSVLLPTPTIQGVVLNFSITEQKRDLVTKVLAFGGGLEATIDGGLVANNTASGVVIVFGGSTLTVKNSSFTGNDVTSGALRGNWSSTLVVSNTNFTHNTVKQLGENYGAGASVNIVGGSANITGSHFVGNRGDGAAVLCINSSHLVINHTSFDNNSAVSNVAPVDSNRSDVDGFGGACRFLSCDVSIDNSSFTNNQAQDGGGAICIRMGRLDMSYSTFDSNIALKGGAVALSQVPSATWKTCHFGRNQARRAGLPPQAGTVQNSGGGAVYSSNSNVTISEGSHFEYNQAVVGRGGAVLVEVNYTILRELNHSNSLVQVLDSRIVGNTANLHGGGIAVSGSYTTNLTNPVLEVRGTNFSGNRAQGGGGCIFVGLWATTHIKDHCHFVNCVASLTGGAICTALEDEHSKADMTTRLTIDATTLFENNTGTGKNIFAGPYFNLTSSLRDGEDNVWLRPEGVVWRRRQCTRGEHARKDDGRYCALCDAATFSIKDRWHNETDCQPSNGSALAPGGAVLVPFSGFWHGRAPLGTTLLEATEDVTDYKPKRCPNPSACQHNEAELALSHPYSDNATLRLTWVEYGRQLCSDGYTGPLCGVCAQGFGSTAPFNCQHCYSAKLHATAHADDGVTQEARPNKVDMSLLYVWYWVALTFWCLWSIGSAFTPAHSSADSQKEAEAGKPCPTPPFDVIKVLVLYLTWMNLVLSMPIAAKLYVHHSAQTLGCSAPKTSVKFKEHPWKWMAASRQPAWDCLSWAASLVLFGTPASLDCMFQAWGLWQNSFGDAPQSPDRDLATHVIWRGFIRGCAVPVVIGLSALLVQLLWYKLRAPIRNKLKGSTSCFAGLLRVALPSIQRQGPKTFWPYLGEHFIATCIVIFYYFYTIIVKTALGLLMGVALAQKDMRWLLDVRLPWPFAPKPQGWAVGAAIMGFVFLLVCLVVPLIFTCLLVYQARRGRLGGYKESELPNNRPPSNGDVVRWVAAGLAHRYADYKISYKELEEGGLSDQKGAMSHVDFRVYEMKLWATLCWDTVLDLFKFLQALVAISVTLADVHQMMIMAAVFGLYLLLMLMVRPFKNVTTSRLQVWALVVLLSSCFLIMALGVDDGYPLLKLPVPYKAWIPWLTLAINLVYALVGVLTLAVAGIRAWLNWRREKLEQNAAAEVNARAQLAV